MANVEEKIKLTEEEKIKSNGEHLIAAFINMYEDYENEEQKTQKSKSFLLLKFLSIPARFIFQMCEIYTCIIIFNIVFEMLIIFISSAIFPNIFIYFYLIFFAFSLGLILLVPMTLVFYELFQFNWFNEINLFKNLNMKQNKKMIIKRKKIKPMKKYKLF